MQERCLSTLPGPLGFLPAAIKGMGSPVPPVQGSTYSEADWNETSTVAKGEAYWVSKVQAERAAWEAAKEAGLDLVTILPGERCLGVAPGTATCTAAACRWGFASMPWWGGLPATGKSTPAGGSMHPGPAVNMRCAALRRRVCHGPRHLHPLRRHLARLHERLGGGQRP